MDVEVKSTDKRVPHILTLKPTLPWPDHICRRGHDMDVRGRHGNGQCAECGRQFSLAWKNGSAVDPVLEAWKPFSLRLREMGLVKGRKTPGTGKHIPSVYLRASKDQRLALLQGLMDTDGHIAECGRCELITVHRRLGWIEAR